MNRSEPGPIHIEPPACVTKPAGHLYVKPGGLLDRIAGMHIPPEATQTLGRGCAPSTAPSAGITRSPQPSDKTKTIGRASERNFMLDDQSEHGRGAPSMLGRRALARRCAMLEAVAVELLCFAVFALVTLGIPLAFMWPYVRDEEVHWPGFTVIERSTVSVGEGAFRDARAQVEREREVDPGMPRALKVATFLVMYEGQFWPIFALYAGLTTLASIVLFFESGALAGLATMVVAAAMVSWTIGARSGWNAAIHVLRGDRKTAEKSLRTSVFAHGLTLLAAVLVVFGAAANSRDAWVFVMSSPFFLLAAMAYAYESLFAKHSRKLPDAVGHAFVDPKTGFVLSGVRVETAMDPASSAAHEQGLHAVSSDKKQV